jgi:hypothetical protein
VHGARSAEIEEEREALHPLDPLHPFALMRGELVERGAMLAVVLLIVGPDVAAAAVGRGVTDGVPLVVAHDGHGLTGVHHAADEMEGLADLRTAVDVVAEEDDLASPRVAVGAVVGFVAKMAEQGDNLVVVTVDVPDEVEGVGSGVNSGIHDSTIFVAPRTG